MATLLETLDEHGYRGFVVVCDKETGDPIQFFALPITREEASALLLRAAKELPDLEAFDVAQTIGIDDDGEMTIKPLTDDKELKS